MASLMPSKLNLWQIYMAPGETSWVCNCDLAFQPLQYSGRRNFGCRCSGSDMLKAAEWYCAHLGGRMPIVVLRKDVPGTEATVTRAQQQADSNGLEGDDLVDALLGLNLDRPASARASQGGRETPQPHTSQEASLLMPHATS